MRLKGYDNFCFLPTFIEVNLGLNVIFCMGTLICQSQTSQKPLATPFYRCMKMCLREE
jgi:hypothetical protein